MVKVPLFSKIIIDIIAIFLSTSKTSKFLVPSKPLFFITLITNYMLELYTTAFQHRSTE